MRQRLDLDTLLRKYESNTLPEQNRHSYHLPTPYPTRSPPPRTRTEASPPPPPFNPPHYPRQPDPRDKLPTTTFQMSKGECQSLLLSLRSQLESEEQRMEQHIASTLADLLARFEREHEELRRELLALVDHSLELSRRTATALLDSHRQKLPREYHAATAHLAELEKEIARLLAGLNGGEFKRTIAEVVTRDFAAALKTVREEVTQANNVYREGLTGVEMDRSKLDKIQESLERVYVWGREGAGGRSRGEVGMRVSEDREELRETRKSSKRKIFEQGNKNKAVTEREEEGSERSAPKRMRRTFFNFDTNY